MHAGLATAHRDDACHGQVHGGTSITGEFVAELLKNVMKDLGLEDKNVIAMSADHAAYIAKASRIAFPSVDAIRYMGCLAHCLQLIVKGLFAAMPFAKWLVDELRSYVTRGGNLGTRIHALNAAVPGARNHLNSVETRWGSSFRALVFVMTHWRSLEDFFRARQNTKHNSCDELLLRLLSSRRVRVEASILAHVGKPLLALIYHVRSICRQWLTGKRVIDSLTSRRSVALSLLKSWTFWCR